MKKRRFLYVLVFVTVLTGCGKLINDRLDNTLVYVRCAKWSVKNTTEKTLYISWKFSGGRRYEEHLLPGYWCCIGRLDSTIPYVESDFEDMLLLNEEDGDITVSIYSEDKKLLKMWKWSERDDPGRQLFDESLWEKNTEDNHKLINTYWRFYILPEDIGQGEN